jgi:hypothetical protein
VHKNISDFIAEYLPGVQVIPTFGNNDWLFHYQSPYEVNKTNFYPVMFENWFEKLPVSSRRADLVAIRETFLNGGYYRMDMSP